DSLVRSLSARDSLERRRRQRLPRPRKPLNARDKIQVDGSDDRQLRAHRPIVSCTRSRRTSQRRQDILTASRPSSYVDGMEDASDVVTQTASKNPEIGLRGVASLRALL